MNRGFGAGHFRKTGGGRTWLQRGPFGNPKNKAGITSAAQPTSPSASLVFRAGGYHNGQQILTGWY